MSGEGYFIKEYYPGAGYFERRFDAIKSQMGFKAGSVDEFNVWKQALIYELKQLTALDAGESCDMKPKIVERVRLEGYYREKILLETEPGIILPVYALIPDGIKQGEKRPVVLALHGHWVCGKYAVAGRYDIPEAAEAIRTYNCDYGVQYVKQGFIVFCPDARGFGDRREEHLRGRASESEMALPCYSINTVAMSLGRTVAGMMAWDNMRLIDYARTREECDGDRIGCCGLSGGGQQSLWLSIFDPRIKCTVISGYFYGFKSSLLRIPDHCSCNYIPHLWEKADMGDLGALIAPRPLLIETGTKDPLNGAEGLDNVYPQVAIARKAYNLFGSGDRLYHHIFEGGHIWSGQQAIPWMEKWLMGD